MQACGRAKRFFFFSMFNTGFKWVCKQECYWSLNTGLIEERKALFDFLYSSFHNRHFFFSSDLRLVDCEALRGSVPEKRL